MRINEEQSTLQLSVFPIGKGTKNGKPYSIYKVAKINNDTKHYFVCLYDDSYANAYYEKRLDEMCVHCFDIRTLPNYETKVEEADTDFRSFFRRRKPEAVKIIDAVEKDVVEVY